MSGRARGRALDGAADCVTNWSQSITFIRIYLLTCNFELTVALATVLANHTSEFRVASLVRPIIVAICDVSMYYVNVTEFQPITRRSADSLARDGLVLKKRSG